MIIGETSLFVKSITILILCILLSSCSTREKSADCSSVLSNSIPITNKYNELKNITTVTGDGNIYFSPLLLPFKIIYNYQNGFSIINNGSSELITPIGTIGIDYVIGSSNRKKINGVTIENSDYLIGFVNKRTKAITLYKITGHNKLKAITKGITGIVAQPGYIEIDITNATIQEFIFENASDLVIVNRTKVKQDFIFYGVNYAGGGLDVHCSIEPQTYKILLHGISRSLENWLIDKLEAKYFIKIEQIDDKNGTIKSLSKEIGFGEVCYIDNDVRTGGVILTKGQ